MNYSDKGLKVDDIKHLKPFFEHLIHKGKPRSTKAGLRLETSCFQIDSLVCFPISNTSFFLFCFAWNPTVQNVLVENKTGFVLVRTDFRNRWIYVCFLLSSSFLLSLSLLSFRFMYFPLAWTHHHCSQTKNSPLVLNIDKNQCFFLGKPQTLLLPGTVMCL